MLMGADVVLRTLAELMGIKQLRSGVEHCILQKRQLPGTQFFQ